MKSILLTIFLIIAMNSSVFSQATSNSSTEVSSFCRSLYDSYDTYKAKEITRRRFKHSEMMKVLEQFKNAMPSVLLLKQLGVSDEGRSINLLSLGSGKKKIFMWSQMHGDEPTATMGLLDALSYISGHLESPEIKKIFSETTLLIIPMLNPDGAERFQRRSVHGIDINRDAKRLQTNEAKILKATRDSLSPEFGFNLHDQEPRYTVGLTGQVATIALLAPAMDYEKSDNPVRARAKKVAAELVNILSPYIAGHISRYDDSYEPRAFGDNIQTWGTSTVLIESGGWKGNPEKMYIRKLNCVALLGIWYSIATNAFEKADIARYGSLPQNTQNLYDIIIHGVTLKYSNGLAPVVVDIGINMEETVGADGVVHRTGKIVDIGDLSTSATFETIDGSGKFLDGSSVGMERHVDIDELRKAMKAPTTGQ
ncbi:MAG: peptidase M14 [Bacteroidota bacterium]|nr:peptidase M14 [Bacteroidota bacterium]